MTVIEDAETVARTAESTDLSVDGTAIRESLAVPGAFGAVFDRHFAALFRYACRRVGRDCAQDVASETFARAFAVRTKYVDSGAGAAPWLFGIATNLLREQRRSEERRLRAYARSDAGSAESIDLDDLAARLDASRSGRQLAVLLLDLRPDERDMLLLTALAGMTYTEVAAALGVPSGTVASRLNRIRERLQPLLPQEEKQ